MRIQAIARGRAIPDALRGEGVAVGVLFVVAVVAYLVLARLRVGPFIDNDEFIYGNLAQSIAGGDGDTWRGASLGQNTLYPYVIAPAWVITDGATAYHVAQAIGVVLSASIVWPVWLVSRTLVTGRWALVAPVLAVLGVWMELSAKIMTEAVAFPAAVWGLCLSVIALRKPGSRWLWGALAAIALAVLARAQLGVLVPVLALAVSLDVLRRPRSEWSTAARARRGDLWVMWGLVAVGLVMLAGPGRSALGDYSGVLDLRPSLSSALRWSLDHATDVVLLVGVVPWIATLALLFSSRVWRSDDLGPFLSVLAPASVGFIALAGWFAAGEAPRVIERYVDYLGPLLVIGLIPALRRASARAVVSVTLVTALVVLGGHDPADRGGEAPGLAATGTRLLGWDAGGGSLWQIALLTSVAGAVIALAAVSRQRDEEGAPPRVSKGWHAAGVGVILAATASWLVNTSDWQWREAHTISTAFRGLFGRIPDDVAGRLHGRTTLVVSNIAPSVPLWLEFFNKAIDRAIVQPGPTPEAVGSGYGPSCAFALQADGRLTSDPSCDTGERRSYLMVMNPDTIPTLRDGGPARPAGVPLAYTVVGRPRLLALRTPLCDLATVTCRPATVTSFAERPAALTLRFRGGQLPQRVAVNGAIHALPASATTTIVVRVATGKVTTTVQGDWQAPSPYAADLVALTLTERGRAAVRMN